MRSPTLDELPAIAARVGWPWTQGSAQLPGLLSDGRPWPRITIVTPSFNQRQFVEEALRSVLLQGYPDLEYIVLDGGSTDGSLDILRKYEKFLSHLRVGPDGGQAAAIRAGFAMATGEVLAWLNSDDYYLPGTLARIGRLFAGRPRLDFASGDVYDVDSGSRVLGRKYAIRPNFTVTANFAIHHWPQQGCFWRRSAYEQVGGLDPSLHFCMDRDLFLRLVRAGPFVRVKGGPLAAFRWHPGAKSSNEADNLVGAGESRELTKRHGNPVLSRFPVALLLLWQPWVLGMYLRRLLHECFEWEI